MTLLSLFWAGVPPPNNENAIVSWRPDQKNKKKKKKKKKKKGNINKGCYLPPDAYIGIIYVLYHPVYLLRGVAPP